MIEGVKELAPELHPVAFRNRNLFENGGVEVGAMRSAKDVAAAIAVGVLQRRGPGGSWNVERRVEPMRNRGIRKLARCEPVRTAPSRVGYRCGEHGCERQPALPSKDTVDLPASEDRVHQRIRKVDAPAFSERQDVNKTLGRAVPYVKAAASAVEEAVPDVLRNRAFRTAALLRGNVIYRMRPGICAQPRQPSGKARLRHTL